MKVEIKLTKIYFSKYIKLLLLFAIIGFVNLQKLNKLKC